MRSAFPANTSSIAAMPFSSYWPGMSFGSMTRLPSSPRTPNTCVMTVIMYQLAAPVR